jgi:UDP-N-acetyl-2-amino-2-deoxyglucuronate dehydrogenase
VASTFKRKLSAIDFCRIEMRNVGLIGAGNISDTHARAAEAAGLNVVAVFGANADKARQLAARHGAKTCDTLDAFLNCQDLELVLIGSPSGRHAEQAAAVVRSGRHVLVEKPLDISTDRVDALLEEVASAGVTLGVFFQDRLKPEVLRLKQALTADAIGTPVLATGEVKWSRPPGYYSGSRWRGSWTLDGGGALMNQGIHTVDLLLYLLGPAVRVSGVIATRVHGIEAEDTAAATIAFETGVIATMAATTAAADGQPRRVEIIGSRGSLILVGDELIDPAARPRPNDTPENARSPVVSDVSSHQRIIEDFVDAVRRGRRPVCDGREGRRSVAVVEAVYRSAREQRVVDLPREP